MSRGAEQRYRDIDSHDLGLIEAFVDSLWLEQGLSQNTLTAYATDLRALAVWLKGMGLGLQQASREQLLQYLAQRVSSGSKCPSAV